MAGSHRAQRSERTGSSSPVPRRVVVGVAVVVLAAAAYLIVDRLGSDSADKPSHTSSALPSPGTTPTTPTATPSAAPASPTATPSQTRPPVPSVRVAPDAPRRLVAGTLIDTGFDSSVTDLDASSASEVARWESRGSPGSPGTDTVYVIGRVYAGGDSAFAALPRLRVGSRVSVRTDRGTMTYTVSATVLKAEASLRRDPLFTARQPGRLVLVGIRYDAAGDRLAKALVVTAQLTGAKRA